MIVGMPSGAARLCFFIPSRVIDGRHYLLTPTENQGLLEPKVSVQYSRPYFSHPKVKRRIAVRLRETKS